MKNSITKIMALSIIAISTIVFAISCSVEDLTQDLTLYTGNGFLVNPVSIQVADAAKQEVAPDNLTITVEGRDKDKIYTMFGEKKIRAISGIVSLAVKSSDAPSASKPLEFSLIFSAPNFTTVRKDYVITEGTTLKTEKVLMINPSAAPKGVSTQTGSFNSTSTGATQDAVFSSPLTNGKTEQVVATLKSGTKTLAADGTPVTGSVQTQLVHFDTRSEASLSGLAEGFSGLAVKEGTATNKVNITPAGFYSMTMSVGTSKITKFSEPMDVTMDIDPEYYNVAQDRKVQVGDVLDVISRDETETTWTSEAQATVVEVNGKLKASFKQSHLSIWIVGAKTRSLCTTSLKIASSINASKDADCAVALETFRYKLVNANNTNLVYSEGTSTLANGEVIDNEVISDPKIATKLIVTDMLYKEIHTTSNQKLCSNNTFDLTGKLPANTSVVVKMNVSAFCDGAINTVFVPTNVTLFYRDMATPTTAPFGGWSPLVTVTDGKGCAKGLKVGRTYDFGLAVPISATQFEMQTFVKDLKQPNGLTIPTGDLTINVASSVYNYYKTLTIKKQTDGSYNLNYDKYALPENICTELDKNFSIFLSRK
ncbi:MAG: hypothetical protein JNL70_00470 [Saprospiraceae bacterium]|nr:hypothetical protein [Saprospiraceae bacterium]